MATKASALASTCRCSAKRLQFSLNFGRIVWTFPVNHQTSRAVRVIIRQKVGFDWFIQNNYIRNMAFCKLLFFVMFCVNCQKFSMYPWMQDEMNFSDLF